MAWVIAQIDRRDVTAEKLYELAREHRLLPDSLAEAIEKCRDLAANCELYEILEDGAEGKRPELIASVIVSGLRGDCARLDFIPRPVHFRDGFHQPIRDAMRPLLTRLLRDYAVQRITAYVPHSRPRTQRALEACGFRPEGHVLDLTEV